MDPTPLIDAVVKAALNSVHNPNSNKLAFKIPISGLIVEVNIDLESQFIAVGLLSEDNKFLQGYFRDKTGDIVGPYFCNQGEDLK